MLSFYFTRISSVILLLFVISPSFSQDKDLQIKVENSRDLRLMFYNCENYFDVEDDSLKSDEEFLPEGDRHWNENKYYRKTMALSKVITGVGGWLPVDIIGLCEVENRKVLDKLVLHTPLYKYNYKVIHKESPDTRGIDVALLYRVENFTPIETQFIPVVFPDANSRTTRDVLYTKAKVGVDTLHVFVNHWPSRWGGQLESEDRRVFVANIVRNKVDSIFLINPKSKIVIMGDLNDEPHNTSVNKVLNANALEEPFVDNALYNMMNSFNDIHVGTHKYQGKWGKLDHIIVSGALFDKQSFHTATESITIYNPEYLLTDDVTHFGVKPFRTYEGFSYKGGFSDHLPVFIDFYLSE